MKKLLLVVYNISAGNEGIAQSDYDGFYKPIQAALAADNYGVTITSEFVIDKGNLTDKINFWLKHSSELYLHFSTHGDKVGIPYGEWVFNNQDLITTLSHPNIKCCFFSSCKSADLVKLASQSEIPIALGAAYDNDLGNSYMIEFQSKFYGHLVAKESFKAAFDKSVVQMNNAVENDAEVIERGGGSAKKVKEQLSNDLQIKFATASDEKLFLIYPNVVDQIKALPPDSTKFLLYTDHAPVKEDFIKYYYQRKFNDSQFLIPVSRTDFVDTVVDFGKAFKKILTIQNVKVLTIIENSNLEMPPLYKEFFDVDHVYTSSNIKFCVAGQNDLANIKNFFDTTRVLNTIPLGKAFTYSGMKALFQQDVFNKFLDGKATSFTNRVKFTMQVPCKPFKKQLAKIKAPENYIRVFFGSRRNEDLMHFVINYVKWKKKNKERILVYDDAMEGDVDLFEKFKSAIDKEFRGDSSLNLISTIANLIDNSAGRGIDKKRSYTFVFKTQTTDQEKFTTAAKKILELFSKSTILLEGHPTPVYIFFICGDDINWQEDWQHDIVVANGFPPAEPITMELVEEWRDEYEEEEEDVYEEVKKVVQEIPESYFKEDCPSAVIAGICEGFLIPRDKFLTIS